jgi:hypothetical protein
VKHNWQRGIEGLRKDNDESETEKSCKETKYGDVRSVKLSGTGNGKSGTEASKNESLGGEGVNSLKKVDFVDDPRDLYCS